MKIVLLGSDDLLEALIGDERLSRTSAFSLCQPAAQFASVNPFISFPLVRIGKMDKTCHVQRGQNPSGTDQEVSVSETRSFRIRRERNSVCGSANGRA